MISISSYSFAGPSFDQLESLHSILSSANHGLVAWDSEWAGRLPISIDKAIERMRSIRKDYAVLDRVTLLSMLLAQSATHGFESKDMIVLVGSARGATSTLEAATASFLKGERLAPQTSPITTAGSISAMTARHIGAESGAMSMSMTCGTGLQALVHACHLRKHGVSQNILTGGVEAPLTPFTKAQFQSLRLLSKDQSSYPSQPLTFEGNRVVLSEGGGFLLLGEGGVFEIIGWGEAMSVEGSAVTFSQEAMERSMGLALSMSKLDTVDVVVPHAPGTQLGDRLELDAIERLMPMAKVYSSKWATGHSLGASGMLGVATALLILEGRDYSMPHLQRSASTKDADTVMVNASGFGGNCTTVILRKRN